MKTPEDICANFLEWPNSWEGLPEDLAYGNAILKIIRPFIEHLISKGLTKKTISRHMDNLWLLGGEIIRDVSLYEEHDIPALQKIKNSINSCGDLYCRHLSSENAQTSYDATCKKLHQFLITQPPSSQHTPPFASQISLAIKIQIDLMT